eukprot:1442375-Pyramimonas_sp.AAC.1
MPVLCYSLRTGGVVLGYGLRTGVAAFLSIPIIILVWALGLEPILSRADDVSTALPALQNVGLALFAAAAIYLTPVLGKVELPGGDGGKGDGGGSQE